MAKAKEEKFEYPKDMLKVAKRVAQFNNTSQEWDQPIDYTALRLAEECNELAKELICMASRPAKTSPLALASEVADVILRLEIFMAQVVSTDCPKEIVKNVIEEKCNKYLNYIKDGEKDII